MEKRLKPATLCVRAGYQPKNGEPVEPPIVQSTTFKYDDSEEMGMLFDLKKKDISIPDCKTQPTMPWPTR